MGYKILLYYLYFWLTFKFKHRIYRSSNWFLKQTGDFIMETQAVSTEVRRGRGRPVKYPFADMEVGQKVNVTTRFKKPEDVQKIRMSVAVAATLYAQRHPEFKFKTFRNRQAQAVTIERVQ